MNDKDNPLDELLNEEEKLAKREEEIKSQKEKIKPPKVEQKPEPKKQKTEEVAMETPQDRFRKILNDGGFKVGIENLTSLFFRGDTDSPEWLDYTLKLGNIPAKNREVLISTYYGKPIEELGIKIEALSVKSKEEKKKDEEKAAASKDSSELDVSKMADDELRDYLKQQKTETALDMIEARREEARQKKEEAEERRKRKNEPQTTTSMMRQIQRPVIVNGVPVTNKDGTILYETIQEPVPTSQGNGGDNLTGVAAILAAVMPKVSSQSSGDSDVAKAITAMNQKIESIQKSTELQAKEDEIKRLNERLDREKEESKKDLEREKKSMNEKLDKIEENRLRDLQDLKERFSESLQHKKELDDVVGAISQQHKKEIDGLKQKVEHATSSIERTLVAKVTETGSDVTKKVGDIAQSVIEPMADVMKDHYRTVIDQTRITAGLPPLKDSIAKVSEGELEAFVRG